MIRVLHPAVLQCWLYLAGLILHVCCHLLSCSVHFSAFSANLYINKTIIKKRGGGGVNLE